MDEQTFVNTYIKLLNDSFNDAINKNIVLQAQLEVAKKEAGKVKNLEAEVERLKTESFDNSGLSSRIKELETQLSNIRAHHDEQTKSINAQLASKSNQAETFKKEVLSCRETILELTKKIQELSSKKRKKVAVQPKPEVASENVIDVAAEAKIEDSSSDTF